MAFSWWNGTLEARAHRVLLEWKELARKLDEGIPEFLSYADDAKLEEAYDILKQLDDFANEIIKELSGIIKENESKKKLDDVTVQALSSMDLFMKDLKSDFATLSKDFSLDEKPVRKVPVIIKRNAPARIPESVEKILADPFFKNDADGKQFATFVNKYYVMIRPDWNDCIQSLRIIAGEGNLLSESGVETLREIDRDVERHKKFADDLDTLVLRLNNQTSVELETSIKQLYSAIKGDFHAYDTTIRQTITDFLKQKSTEIRDLKSLVDHFKEKI